MRRVVALVAALTCLALAPLPAAAHSERTAANPPNNDAVPVPTHRDINPADPNLLVVCKPDSGAIIDSWPEAWHNFKAKDHALLARCQFDNLQAAVDAVQHGGTNIAVMPGTYLEEKTTDTSTWSQHCKDLLAAVASTPNLSYADQLACPHVTQEVAILGDPDSVQKGLTDGDGNYDCDSRLCNLQLEGMGRDPTETVFDNKFHRLNAIRADRAWGFYIRNLTTQHTEFNGVYVIEADGYAIDSILSRWNFEYGFLSFTVDHGLWQNCETYGNGDSGLYPGGQAQRFGFRPSVEVRNCSTHHNTAGTSGTAGDSVFFHDNLMYDNMTGISNDSLAAHHPGTPQNSALYLHNRIFSNNEDLYYYVRTTDPNDSVTPHRTYCNRPVSQIDYEHGVVCPSFIWPTGTGMMIAGGNFNVVAENWFFDNWRIGADLFTVPAALRGCNPPDCPQFDNSHANRYYQNHMGFGPAGTPGGTTHPNGLDFWWDESGVLNCWQENVPAPGHQLYSDPPYNTEGTYQGHPSIGGRPTGSAGPNGLPVCFPQVEPTNNTPPQGVKAGLEAHCSTYALYPSDPSQSNDPALCAWNHAPPPPPDRVATGFGVNPGQEVLPPDKAPCQPGGEPCWSLGWVNPPDGAAAQQPPLFPPNLPAIVNSLPNTVAPQLPLIGLFALAMFALGLRVGRAWRRRSPAGAADARGSQEPPER